MQLENITSILNSTYSLLSESLTFLKLKREKICYNDYVGAVISFGIAIGCVLAVCLLFSFFNVSNRKSEKKQTSLKSKSPCKKGSYFYLKFSN